MSVTTRPPRPGEVDGREYYFVDDSEFDRLVSSGALLEWAELYGRQRSGTPRAPVEERLNAGVPALLEIDVNGARQVKHAVPDARMVFLAPPSWDELVRRLTGRGTESPEVIARRLAVARDEMAAADEFETTLVNTSVRDVSRELITLMKQCALSFLEGRTWQGLSPSESQTASSTRRSTTFSMSWTASTSW